MTLFERFSEGKEDGFREHFIQPLLIRLGFFGISNKHGSQEFGKDFVCSEFDPFGQMRHLAIQAKHIETLHQGRAVDDLVSQIEQCFYVEYTLPSAPAETRRVSSVYVFNSGEIPDNAERQLRTRLKREFQANVRVFGGQQLEIIAKTHAQRDYQRIRERLDALFLQLHLNIGIWTTLKSGFGDDLGTSVFDMRGPILHAIEEYLSAPVLPEILDANSIGLIWQRAKRVHNIESQLYYREMLIPPENFQKRKSEVISNCQILIDEAIALMTRIELANSTLQPVTI